MTGRLRHPFQASCVRGWHGTLASLIVCATFAVSPAVSPLAAQSDATHALVISGLGGEPGYAERMHAWAATTVTALRERFGIPAAQVAWLAENGEIDARVSGRSTKEEIEAAIAAIASRAAAGDVVLIVLYGHGGYQSGESRFSMPGPDLTPQAFDLLLDRLATQKVVFVNTTSASGEFVKVLSGPGRVIVTATRSGAERNATRFGEHFAAALAEDVADTDKDGAVSMLEAFVYARTQTNRSYEEDRALPTEHAVLDDDGDAKGTDEPDPQDGKGDGVVARATFLGQAAVVAGAAPPSDASPALRALYAERQKIEQRLATLRAAKDTMDARQYETQLEDLLVELALKNQEIRRMEGGR